jgi:hypothetical protein
VHVGQGPGQHHRDRTQAAAQVQGAVRPDALVFERVEGEPRAEQVIRGPAVTLAGLKDVPRADEGIVGRVLGRIMHGGPC